jgi:hypothetical protein
MMINLKIAMQTYTYNFALRTKKQGYPPNGIRRPQSMRFYPRNEKLSEL